MNLIADSLPSCAFVSRPSLALMALMIGAGAALTSCGKKEEEPAKAPAKQEAAAIPPATEAPKPPTPPVPAAPVEKPTAAAPSAPASPSTPDPSVKELSQRVAAFKAFHPYSTGAELARIPQFTSQLEASLNAIAGNPVLLERVQKVVSNPQDLTNSAHPAKIDLKISNYSLTFSDRLLAAVLSGKPERLVDLVLQQAPAAEFIVTPGK